MCFLFLESKKICIFSQKNTQILTKTNTSLELLNKMRWGKKKPLENRNLYFLSSSSAVCFSARKMYVNVEFFCSIPFLRFFIVIFLFHFANRANCFIRFITIIELISFHLKFIWWLHSFSHHHQPQQNRRGLQKSKETKKENNTLIIIRSSSRRRKISSNVIANITFITMRNQKNKNEKKWNIFH